MDLNVIFFQHTQRLSSQLNIDKPTSMWNMHLANKILVENFVAQTEKKMSNICHLWPFDKWIIIEKFAVIDLRLEIHNFFLPTLRVCFFCCIRLDNCIFQCMFRTRKSGRVLLDRNYCTQRQCQNGKINKSLLL